ncbi:MAG: FtsK/SpoIIIE family proteinFtsk gamma protein [Actinomycetia bacterium]|nr:FtsK/SpoIIIE family proteinFtsk gamma protein [Actinomycetes bacterium]
MSPKTARKAARRGGRSGRGGARRSYARGRAAEPTRLARSREAFGAQLGDHRADFFAVVLIVLGALSALALATDLAGPVGVGARTAGRALLGFGQPLIPIGCFAVAGLVVWSNRPPIEPDEDDEYEEYEDRTRKPLRVATGLFLLLVAMLGIMHLAGGAPGFGDGVDALGNAGGVAGATIGAPHLAGIGIVGASIVLAAIALLGALLTPGVPISSVVGVIGVGLAWAGREISHFLDFGADELDEDEDEEELEEGEEYELEDGEEYELEDEEYEDEEEELEEEDEEDDEEILVAGYGDDEDDDEIDLTMVDAPHASLVAADSMTGAPTEQLAINLGRQHLPPAWKLPPRTILEKSTGKKMDRGAIEAGGEVLEATLHEFGVDAHLIGMTIGPTVTRYELELGAGVKVNKVTGLNHDIAYAMASADVRILAPIPGRSAIGVEVPNKTRQLVTLGDILTSPEANEATHPLEVGLGRDIAGKAVMMNLATMPHLLIAGQTGAGKSSCINSIITSILMRTTPEQVRLILVDPKRVELGAYNDLPHLLTPVVTSPKKAANALDWAVREMDMRYELLSEVGVRDITGYNAAYDRGELPTLDEPDPITGKGYARLPFILVVIDELNDLMMVAARDVEASICRIAQMARAVGIHLVIATQRPSVDVITGVIKANVPSRLAFSVSSATDSRVILDTPGAEKLVGQGDMLLSTATGQRDRIQGSWVDEASVRKAVAHWKRQTQETYYVEGVAEGDDTSGGPGGGGGDTDDTDDLLAEAMELVVRSGLGSTSMLQRKLRVGFSRAGRIMDLLERKGIVGPSEGSKARTVLMTVDEFEAASGRTD